MIKNKLEKEIVFDVLLNGKPKNKISNLDLSKYELEADLDEIRCKVPGNIFTLKVNNVFYYCIEIVKQNKNTNIKEFIRKFNALHFSKR